MHRLIASFSEKKCVKPSVPRNFSIWSHLPVTIRIIHGKSYNVYHHIFLDVLVFWHILSFHIGTVFILLKYSTELLITYFVKSDLVNPSAKVWHVIYCSEYESYTFFHIFKDRVPDLRLPPVTKKGPSIRQKKLFSWSFEQYCRNDIFSTSILPSNPSSLPDFHDSQNQVVFLFFSFWKYFL